jgi:hypothetical protein
LATAYQGGRDLYKAQTVKDAAVLDERARELFTDHRERIAFIAGYAGQHKRARRK